MSPAVFALRVVIGGHCAASVVVPEQDVMQRLTDTLDAWGRRLPAEVSEGLAARLRTHGELRHSADGLSIVIRRTT